MTDEAIDPEPAGAATPLDLDCRRNIGELLEATFRIFGSHFAVLYTLTFLVLAPATLLVDGLWGHQLRDGIDAESSVEQGIVSGIGLGLVVPALITAIHVGVVRRIAGGARVSIGEALRDAVPRLWPVTIVLVLYGAGIIGGTILLIVPGIWVSVAWYFGPQIVMVEGLGPWGAIRRSAALVGGQWWRTCGLLTVSFIVFGAIAAPLFSVAVAVGSGPVYLGSTILFETLTTSILALFGTLLFFDLVVRATPRSAMEGFLPPIAPVVTPLPSTGGAPPAAG